MTGEFYSHQGGLARNIDRGRVLVLYEQIFNWRLCIGYQADMDESYDDFYCYPKARFAEAMTAMLEWDGEGDPPDGWSRHGGTGRRRPGGDPAKEETR